MQKQSFADKLTTYTEARGLSDSRLAKLTNLPRYTIRNWLRGVTKSPRHWQDILQVAQALRLDMQEVNALLAPTKHPSLYTLWQQAQPVEKQLFKRWQRTLQTAVSAPFLAPPHIPYFVGRQQIQQQISHYLLNTDSIVTIQGMGGVGKTTLATQLAYTLQPAFPDGVLWANVHATDPLTILNMFAIAYGENATPFKTIASRSQFIRNLLGTKKALLILDNVDKSQQIEPILPPTNGNCRVIITTRHHNLSIIRGWPKVTLQSFTSTDDSLALFAQLLDITPKNTSTLTQIAHLLGNLPLALAIVSGRLAYEPHWSAEQMLDALQQHKTRLSTVTDEGQSVRLSFDISYQALSVELQSFFIALSLFAQSGFSAESVSAVTNIPPPIAQTYLTDLVTLSLVQEMANGRYTLHPLMRTYAQEKQTAQANLHAYVAHFVHYATTHTKQLEHLDLELDNILNALDQTDNAHAFIEGISALNHYLAIRGLDTLALPYIKKGQELAQQQPESQAMLLSYEGTILERAGHYSQAEKCYKTALQVAYRTEDTKTITIMLQHMGRIMKEQKQFNRAHDFLVQSLQLAQQNNQHDLVCNLYNSLGALTISHYGDYAQAQTIFEQGLSLAQQNNYHRMIYFFTLNLGGVAFRQGNYAQASRWYEESLSTAQQLGYPMGIGIVYRGLSGVAISHQGNHPQAERLLYQAIDTVQKTDPRLLGYLFLDLSLVLHQQKKRPEATFYLAEGVAMAEATEDPELQRLAYWVQGSLSYDSQFAQICFQQALALAETHTDGWNLCEVLLAYGAFIQKQGDSETAVTHFTRLQTISHQQGFPAFEGAALFHLAQIAYQHGEISKAEQLGHQSLTLWRQIKHYRAPETRSWLAARIP